MGERTASISLSYLAGFIDGEGCLRLNHYITGKGIRRFIPQLVIANTDLRILEMIKDFIGEGSINERKRLSDKHKYGYEYALNSEGLRRLLSEIKNKLVVKKLQAELLIEYLKYNHKGNNHRDWAYEKKLKAYYKMKELNRKGSTNV